MDTFSLSLKVVFSNSEVKPNQTEVKFRFWVKKAGFLMFFMVEYALKHSLV